MTIPTITTPPATVPVRSMSRAAFNTAMADWLAWQKVHGDETPAIVAFLDERATDAEVAASTVVGSPSMGATSSTSVTIGENTSKSFAFNESGKNFGLGQYVSFAASSNAAKQMNGYITAVDNTAKTMTIFVPTGAALGLGETYASWVITPSGRPGVDVGAQTWDIEHVPFSTNTTFGVSNRGDAMVYTGTGGHVLTLTSIGTLGANFPGGIINKGTGYVDITPSGANIDGRASIRVYPGEGFTFSSSASEWRTFGRSKRVKVSSQTISASVTTVSFETGHPDTDTEVERVIFKVDEVVCATNATPGIKLKKGGSYVATNYNGAVLYGNSAVNNAGWSGASAVLHPNNGSGPTTISGEVVISSLANGQRPQIRSTVSRATTGLGGQDVQAAGGFLNDTSSAVQGTQFHTGGAVNMTAGTITQWIERVA